MRKLIYIALVIFASTLFAQKEISILRAEKQSWAGGPKGSGSGTNYYFSIKTFVNSDSLHFDTLWLGDRFYPITQFFVKNMDVKEFKANDTLFFSLQYYRNVRNPDFDKNYNLKKSSHNFHGEALLKYTYINEIHYFEIKKLKQLEYLAYP